MAPSFGLLLALSALAFSPFCFGQAGYGGSKLVFNFYQHSCPQVEEIVKNVMAKAVYENPRWAASILRLSFHDCFADTGCDASLLLDSSGTIVSEKRSNPNRNSARGFEIIDEIKSAVEESCPGTVSCADILILAGRDGVVLTGGPYWEVPLGRRDSRTASISESNNNIPAPNNTFDTILSKFNNVGLDLQDLVALSGSHTIGISQCKNFRQRLYNQNGDGKPDSTLDPAYASYLQTRCPKSGGDQIITQLDKITGDKFDNGYYKNLIKYEGLLNSDEVLYTRNEDARKLVELYAENQDVFFQHFVQSIIKMTNIVSLSEGEIRTNCRRVNQY